MFICELTGLRHCERELFIPRNSVNAMVPEGACDRDYIRTDTGQNVRQNKLSVAELPVASS